MQLLFYFKSVLTSNLQKTIKSYALGVFLSDKLHVYKGTLPINLVYVSRVL